MTVAPELPPASAPRGRGAEPQVAPPARARRRHPFGSVAHASTRTASPTRVGRPVPRRSREWMASDLPTAPEPTELVGQPEVAGAGGDLGQPDRGAGRERRPAAPARLRPVGVRPTGERVVRPARPRPRLTRRGRALVAAAVLMAALTASLAATDRIDALREPVPPTAPAVVVVAPGETLWTIAERVAPDRDPRVVVDQIRRVNHLPSGDVQAGQTLRLRTP